MQFARATLDSTMREIGDLYEIRAVIGLTGVDASSRWGRLEDRVGHGRARLKARPE